MNRSFSIIRFLPNLITIMALVVGFGSVYFAIELYWKNAALCVVIALILDMIDGKVARLLKATSSFGIELDSLSDLINFGVSPAVMFYMWIYRVLENKMWAWGVVVFYVICVCLRLARFNLFAHNINDDYTKKYFFVGVPAPVGGMYIILPIIIDFSFSEITKDINKFFLLPYVFFVAILVASRISTFSLKYIKIPAEYIWLLFSLFAIIVVLFVLYPWYSIIFFMLLYTISILFSFMMSRKIL